MAFTEHASKKYVDERDALLATKNALNAEAEERERLANIVAQNRRDTYSKDEVNRIVDALRGARFVKVQALPELADADTRAIYLVPRVTPEAGNSYDEWIVVVDDEGARSWDKLGSTDIDLSGYATKEWVGNEFTTKDTFNREFGSLQGQMNNIGTTANRAYSDAQTAKGAAYAAQRSADAAGSAAAAALQTADDAQSTAETAQETAETAQQTADNKLDKENGTADGLVMKSGSYALKFDTFSGTIPRLVVGTVDAQTGVISWGGSYFLSSSAIGAIVQTDTLNDAVAKRLGIGNIYRLVGKTPGGAECNLVWYNMKTGSIVSYVIGFTAGGVVKTVKSLYITASPSFPDVAVSVTDSNNVSYEFSGTAETLNLHEVATRGECAAKRDYQDILLGTVVENWTQRGREAENAVYSWSDTYGMWVNAHNDKISGPRFVKEVSNNTYADPVTGNAPVYTFIGSDGSVLGSASAANLDLFIQEGGWQFYVGTAKTAADSLARKSEVDKKLDASAMGFPEFSPDVAYQPGVAVIHEGHAYISNTAHSPGAWDPGHFDELPVVVNRTAATGGIAVGPDAKVYEQHGTAVGHGAEVSAEKATAIGYNAKVAAGKTGAVQLGAGTNQQAYSFQFRGTTVVNTDGKIPAASLDKAIPSLAGETMPETPTQNQLAEAVKKIFVALGGTIV